jgi:hypothetical protein
MIFPLLTVLILRVIPVDAFYGTMIVILPAFIPISYVFY